MKLREIGQILARAGASKPEDLSDAYLKHFKEIHRAIYTCSGLKSDLRIKEDPQAEDLIRFCAFAYDLTTLSVPIGKAVEMKLIPPDALKNTFGVDNIHLTVPKDMTKDVFSDSQDPGAMPGLMMSTDQWSAELINLIAPLMVSGRLLIRPIRCVVTLSKINDTGQREFKVHNVDEQSPFDHWNLIPDSSGSESIPILPEASLRPSESALFEVSYPFLTGIPFKDLAKILEDEEYHLTKARSSLKETINEAKEQSKEVSQIANDVVRPALDRLSRRLETISQGHWLKTAGAMTGIATLTLVAASTGGLPQVLAALGGASGIGLLTKEAVDYHEKVADLKEDPFYLLWRCREIIRQQ